MMYKVIWMDAFKIVKKEKVDYSAALRILMNEGMEEDFAASCLVRAKCPYELVTEEGYLLKIKEV